MKDIILLMIIDVFNHVLINQINLFNIILNYVLKIANKKYGTEIMKKNSVQYKIHVLKYKIYIICYKVL